MKRFFFVRQEQNYPEELYTLINLRSNRFILKFLHDVEFYQYGGKLIKTKNQSLDEMLSNYYNTINIRFLNSNEYPAEFPAETNYTIFKSNNFNYYIESLFRYTPKFKIKLFEYEYLDKMYMVECNLTQSTIEYGDFWYFTYKKYYKIENITLHPAKKFFQKHLLKMKIKNL